MVNQKPAILGLARTFAALVGREALNAALMLQAIRLMLV